MSPGVFRTRLDRISSYEEARDKARGALPRGLFDYVDGGSEGEYTMRRNVEAFEEPVWRPKQAIYHEQIDAAIEVPGVKVNHEMPAGSGRLVTPARRPGPSRR